MGGRGVPAPVTTSVDREIAMSSSGTPRRTRRPPIVLLAAALAATAAAVVGIPATAHADVVNGAFDDGLAGWNIYPNAALVDGWGCNDVPAGTGA
jgi:endoglucanase